ncbi:tripartite tricarboxylate transporter substrate binding protein [Verminephrobacter aporrectodeae subsp. tuberculatae]|uniref:Tripartite tricarboxylate transporter substrate binding protein n=1 Tax=Verminephrobacter aporrectodeae subsp. tuberculatae TaxID=1110392 RepID=A0ABT3KUE5_9BURK|nr:tripartite tricarboxylate transporter substrate binding protein [Verminephrobacter aporrectodeae]MCW5321962.1 tripartite tricarboxylate transporter substrate binding protein [Verminephrobacter aporrectodeae subsp. tuberculatae]
MPISFPGPARTLWGLLAGLALALPAAQGQSPVWPARPIKLMVPFPPGGSTDTIGRLLAGELGQSLGQSVVVENKAGANGGIGTDQVAKLPADGYSLLLSGIGSNATNYSLQRNTPYKDAAFRHVALLATGPSVLVVNPQFAARTVADLVRMAKERPGAYAHASAGNGSSGHLALELFKQTHGLQITHVPYKGNAQAITDVMAGQVPIMALNNDTALAYVRAGRLRALAVTSLARNPAFPQVPTMAESGIPGFDVVSWFGLSVPAGTPDAVISRLADATAQALQAPKLRQYLEGTGFVVASGTPGQFSDFVSAEIAKWQAVIQRAGITAD